MRSIIIISCVLIALTGCSNKPKELLAPCSWDHRSGCGNIIAISHQEQL